MPPALAGIEACAFDAYGTLFDYASAAARCRDVLGDRFDALTALWRDKQLQYTWLRSLQGRHADFWRVTGDALNFALETLDLADAELRRRLMQLYLSLDVVLEVPDVLRRLKAAGVKTAILSNGSPDMVAAAVTNDGIDDLFDAVLSVEAVGVYKPHRKVYQLAVDRLGLPAATIVFLSSNSGTPGPRPPSAFVIRVWVPESPRWLIGRGRFEEARRSLAWALQIDPKEISLPTSLPETRQVSWLELFKYPRSIAAACLTGLSQTGGVGLALWQVTLLVPVLEVTPAYASYLTIWISLVAIFGRFFFAWLSDAMGRRPAGILTCLAAAVTMSLAGYWHDAYRGTVSLFYALIVINSLFGPGTYAIIGPYMTEVWPAPLRASGLGLAYGTSNLGKFIGPAGLALLAGTSNFVSPQATLDAIIPAFDYFAVWYVLAALVFWLVAIETRGRTIEELDAALTGRAAEPAPVKPPAQ